MICLPLLTDPQKRTLDKSQTQTIPDSSLKSIKYPLQIIQGPKSLLLSLIYSYRRICERVKAHVKSQFLHDPIHNLTVGAGLKPSLDTGYPCVTLSSHPTHPPT
jgi:hypothetical protein